MKNALIKCQTCFRDRKIVVDILIVLFGIGTWVGINGMFVQLPLLVETAPEGWDLPSYMSVAVQLANLGPLTYALFRRFWPNKLNDVYCIYAVLVIGALSAVLLSFFYDYITYINGNAHSTVFLCLVFLTAIVGCTSSVLFFPFMRHFKEIYLITYLIGEGLSGFLPSIVALIQGVGGNPECITIEKPDGNITTEKIYKEPLFSTSYYFGFIAFAMILSLIAFILLNKLNVCLRERVASDDNELNKVTEKINISNASAEKSDDIKYFETISIAYVETPKQNNIPLRSISLLILMSTICAFSNGVFPSIQSYSCLPYGNTAYHLAATLSSMANPIACFLAAFLPHTTNRSISILSSICAIFIAYVVSTSVMSPTPPLHDAVSGVVIVVLVWIVVVGLVSYIKLCISTIFRSVGGSWMFYCGGASQAGSAIGSLVSFFLVNYTNIFVASDVCQSFTQKT